MSTATLTWTIPTTRTDGTPLAPSDVASVSVYDDASPTPAVALAVLPGSPVTFTTDTLSPGVHDYTVSCHRCAGQRLGGFQYRHRYRAIAGTGASVCRHRSCRCAQSISGIMV